jgi:tetratricopeptide (TPR) repeat protein
MAAKALYELDQLDESIELLLANMGDYDLDPTNVVWRDSIFQLGETIFRQGNRLVLESTLDKQADWGVRQAKLEQSHERFLTGVKRLGEAVSRYPNDPRYYEARYLIAKSHRLAAEMPRQTAKGNKSLVESARRSLMQDRRQHLEQALAEFQSLHRDINRSQDFKAAQSEQTAIVRNCFFGEADTLFDLGRYDEAIQAYQNVTSHYFNQPESLEALLQMAMCYRKLGETEKVDRALLQAEQVLNRIPPELDSRFVQLTRASRQGWVDLIGSIRTWD